MPSAEGSPGSACASTTGADPASDDGQGREIAVIQREFSARFPQCVLEEEVGVGRYVVAADGGVEKERTILTSEVRASLAYCGIHGMC